MKVLTLVLVAASAFATDSVDGQRGRPSGVMRFDLLKVVGSRPDFLARPEGVSLARAARRSRAVQIWLWVSMGLGGLKSDSNGECLSIYRNYNLGNTSRGKIFVNLDRLPT